jgi:hypothetical protein
MSHSPTSTGKSVRPTSAQSEDRPALHPGRTLCYYWKKVLLKFNYHERFSLEHGMQLLWKYDGNRKDEKTLPREKPGQIVVFQSFHDSWDPGNRD